MRRDFGLLLLVFVILLLGHAVLWYAYPGAWAHFFPGRPWLVLAPPVAMTLAWGILLGVLCRRGRGETLIIPVVALLAGFGLLFLLRLAGGAYTLQMSDRVVAVFFASFQKQQLFFGLGWLALLLLVTIPWDVRALARYKYLVACTAVVLLLATTLIGHTTAEQQLSINLGIFSFQPHDPVKLLLVIFMAAYLAEHREMLEFVAVTRTRLLSAVDLRYLGPMVGLWLLVMGIVFVHKDLGAALLLFGILLGMLYLGTGRKTYVIMGTGLFAVGGYAAYHLFTRIQSRVAIWLDPWRPEFINAKSFQICQALMALGNGRVIGAGLGGGYPESIPAVHTDMIYAAISEDLGLVGAVVLVALFVVVIQRGFVVALRTSDRFGQLLAAGLAVSIAFQTLVILGGVVKAIPLTGITLPFISYGGTSLVVNFVMLGLLLKVSGMAGEASRS